MADKDAERSQQDDLPPAARVIMWASFLVAVVLLMIARLVSGA